MESCEFIILKENFLVIKLIFPRVEVATIQTLAHRGTTLVSPLTRLLEPLLILMRGIQEDRETGTEILVCLKVPSMESPF